MEQEKELTLEQEKRILTDKQYKELKQLILDYGAKEFSCGLAIGGSYHKEVLPCEEDLNRSLTNLSSYLISITNITKGE